MSVQPGSYIIINKQSGLPIGRQNINDRSPNPQNIVGQLPLRPPPMWEILPKPEGKFVIQSNHAPAAFVDNAIKVIPIPQGQDILWNIRGVGEHNVYTISNDARFWTFDLNGQPPTETLVTLSTDKSDKAQWILELLY